LQHAQGFAGVAIFAGFQDSPVGLLVHDPGPATWADVTGKVAMEDGSPFQRFLWSKMGWEGKVARVPTTGGLGAFATDETLSQQAYVTSEPCVAEAKGIAARFLPARDIGWNPYASLAVVKTEDSGAEWAKAFVAASREGWEAYLKEPSAANLEIAKINPEMTVEAMRCISERQAPFVRGAGVVGQVEPARMVEVAAALSAATGQVVSAEGVTAAVKVEVDRTIIRGDGVLGGAAERVERDEERDRAR
jgi:NitT/TauT family transport system substrate-binding protein